MISFKIPGFLSFGKKYGLLLSDTDASVVSWSKGNLESLAVFANTEEGVEQFSDFLQKNARVLGGKPFYFLANIIGEDYRVEKVAHLIGKYKTDFHSRRMTQLFRGSQLIMSVVQGREEHGRREDIVLFYGLLTENKVLPWLATLSRSGSGAYLAGIHTVSFVNQPLLQKVAGTGWSKGNKLFLTLHEKGLLRQTYYANSHVQFSRVSKIQDESAGGMVDILRKELERTIQYLNSLKISVVGGIDVYFVCPGNIIGQLRERLAGGEKIRFSFHDAATVAQGIGMGVGVGESGRDSSLSLHCLFSYLRFSQLASFDKVRYYWANLFSRVAVVAFVVYGVFNIFPILNDFLEGYEISQQNTVAQAERDDKKRNYEEQFRLEEDPPSSPENITAVSRVFELVSNLDITPTQLVYYLSTALAENRKLVVNNIEWFVTSDAEGNHQSFDGMFQGQDLFQVLVVEGEFESIANETYLDVANRAEKLIASFEERSDIAIIPVELPQRSISTQELSGTISQELLVDAAKDRAFVIRIVWKSHDKELIARVANKQI